MVLNGPQWSSMVLNGPHWSSMVLGPVLILSPINFMILPTVTKSVCPLSIHPFLYMTAVDFFSHILIDR